LPSRTGKYRADTSWIKDATGRELKDAHSGSEKVIGGGKAIQGKEASLAGTSERSIVDEEGLRFYICDSQDAGPERGPSERVTPREALRGSNIIAEDDVTPQQAARWPSYFPDEPARLISCNLQVQKGLVAAGASAPLQGQRSAPDQPEYVDLNHFATARDSEFSAHNISLQQNAHWSDILSDDEVLGFDEIVPVSAESYYDTTSDRAGAHDADKKLLGDLTAAYLCTEDFFI
jgi:hypothetical protein